MYQYYYKFYSNIVIACCYFQYFYNIWCGSSPFEELVGYPRLIIDFHLGNLLGPYRMVHTKVIVEIVSWLNYEQTRCSLQLVGSNCGTISTFEDFNIWRFYRIEIKVSYFVSTDLLGSCVTLVYDHQYNPRWRKIGFVKILWHSLNITFLSCLLETLYFSPKSSRSMHCLASLLDQNDRAENSDSQKDSFNFASSIDYSNKL